MIKVATVEFFSYADCFISNMMLVDFEREKKKPHGLISCMKHSCAVKLLVAGPVKCQIAAC